MKYGTLVVVIFLCIVCDAPDDGGSALTSFPTVTQVTFGSSWTNSCVTDTGRTFDSTEDTTIYYEIMLDSVTGRFYQIRKEWIYSSNTLFTSMVMVPDSTLRICGQFCRFDQDTLSNGNYELLCKCLADSSGEYVDIDSDSSVSWTFTLQ